MLNKVTKSSWLLWAIFAILSYGCSTSGVNKPEPGQAISHDRPPKYLYAIELLKRGDSQKAKEQLLSIEDSYKHEDLYINLAIIELNNNNIDNAANYIEKSISMNSGNYISHNLHGVILRKCGKFADATHAYSRSVSLNPDYADAYLNLAILHDVYLDSPKQALPYYEKYKSLSNGNDENIEKWLVELSRRIK